MIERKCEKTWPFQYLLRSLVNTMLAAPCSLAIASIPDYVRCASAIGRYLLRRGKPVVDANGPMAGLPGIHSEAHGRKYFRGPHRPRLGSG
jgi:hypothetical protein